MRGLLIKGGRVVDPANSLDVVCDVLLRDGLVQRVGANIEASRDDATLDAAGAVVAPGFVDMHVHLREPGFPQKETLETGTEAALRGGFTTVACMPNTKPALDDPATVGALCREVERRARCRVVPIAAITRGRAGREPCDFTALAQAGAVAYSDDGDSVEDGAVLRAAAALARSVPAPFVSHCVPEESLVERDLQVAGETRKQWHIAHVSTHAALEAIRSARTRGVRVTCEVTPHHLTFTSAVVARLGSAATVNPPLRGEDDVEAMRAGVLDGTIDAFASDHAPHAAAEKRGSDAAPGFSGLEVAAGAYAAALPGLPLKRFVELISTSPSRILRLPAGTLTAGAPADVTIFAEIPWTVETDEFASLGRCTPFAGRTLPRKILAAIVGGEIRYRAAELAP